jgi:hypothetical protein
MVPTNPQEWQPHVLRELVDRLPDLESRIADFKVVLNNNKGDALILVTLEGNRAFIPAIIKEWVLEPMDVIIYKKGNETKTCYLSERNLNRLSSSSAVGKNIMGGRNDNNLINYFSPEGGGMQGPNPFSGFNYNYLTKMGNYIEEKIKEANYKDLIDLPEAKEKESSYAVITKTASGYKAYYDKHPNGIHISAQGLSQVMKSLPEVERFEKFASLETRFRTYIGDLLPRPGNIRIRPKETGVLPTKEVIDRPNIEGIFLHRGDPVYINPHVQYLDGAPSTYALAVKPGKFTVAKQFQGFRANNASDSSLPTREQLLPEIVHIDSFKPGKYYCLFSDKSRKVSIPFKLVNISHDLTSGGLTILVKPLIGADHQCQISFEDTFNNGVLAPGHYVYSSLHTRICALPEQYMTEAFIRDPEGEDFDGIPVCVYNLGGSYGIKENGVSRGAFDEGKFIFEMTSRYGFSPDQAEEYVKSLKREQKMHFQVRTILTEACEVAPLNDDVLPNEREKEALDQMLKVASSIYDFAQKPFYHTMDFKEKLASVVSLTSNLLKTAQAVPTEDPGAGSNTEQAQQQADQNAQQMGAMFGTPAVYQAMLQTGQMDKYTKQIIDMLLYYYKGKLRTEDYTRVLAKLKRILEDAENELGKVLLLALFDKIPGQDYEDVRLLLSDMDNFLQSLNSSMVIMNVD